MTIRQKANDTQSANSLRQGLTGEYLFDGSADDTSGNEHHGKVVGATLTSDRFGEANRAYAFSGQGDYIVLDPPPALNEKAFSISVWIKYGEKAALKGWNNAIISQDDHGREKDKLQRVFQLSTKGALLVWHRMGGSRDPVSKLSVQPGVWYHVAAVYDGARHKLYVNGQLHDEQAGSFRPNAVEPIFFGKKNSDEPRFWFCGDLDDIRIYNRDLTENEVMELFAEHGYTGEPGLVTTAPQSDRTIRAASTSEPSPFPVKKTLDRPKINWNDCYNSFARALHGAILYSSRPIDMPHTLIYTGQAFAINTDTNVSPMDVFGDGSLLEAALNNLGFDMKVVAANLYGGDWDERTVDKALNIVRESIDRGMAVVGWNLDNYEHGLIYGYDDERRVLNIHDINARNGGELSYDEFGRRPRNGTPIEPEMFVLALSERKETPHLSVTRYTEQADASYRTTLRTALFLAIRHIEDEGREGVKHRNGIAAIDAWISAFEAGTAHSFFTSYNVLWITSSRQYMVPFFVQSSITYCMAIQDYALQQLMMKAAEVYLASFRAWVGLRELFPFPKSADTKDPHLKEEAIKLLREAREAEAAGAAILHEMAERLS